ncbi:MAG: M20/M25/M40 family metallo-hydrolase [Lachnospiraceae bacterium]
MHHIEVTDSLITELVELIKTIAAIPAPSGQEDARAAFVKEYLEKAGYAPVVIDEAKNVIVEVAPDTAGQAAAENLRLYTAHTDVVFPDTTTLPVREERGLLLAPGVGDDTANLAGMLLSMKYIKNYGKERPLTPRYPIVYVADSGEEGLGNLKGMWAAYHRYEKCLARHIAFDGCTAVVVNRAVGSSRYEITVRTEGGHSYNNFGNRNAIAVASDMISALYQADTNDLPGKTTYNVGIIQGGTSVNTIAQQVTFCYEYRSDEQEGLTRMKAIAEKIFAKTLDTKNFALEDGFTINAKEAEITIKVIGERPGMGPVEEKTQTELSDHVADLLEKYTGKRPGFTSGSTDCNIPLSKGIPAACFGIYLGQGTHTREEYIEIASLKAGMQTMLELLLEDYE